MATFVNICSCNGLLPDSSKPLLEQMLAYHQWGTEVQWHPPEATFTRIAQDINSQNESEKYFLKLLQHLSGANELTLFMLKVEGT